MPIFKGISFLLLLILSASPAGTPSKSFDYNIEAPTRKMNLDNTLVEISGLTIWEGRMFAVQDENGIIYELDKETGDIRAKWKFHKDGDYEGIEVVDGFAYVLKSNGNIYKSKLFSTDEEETIKYDFDFDKKLNFEGLGYDPATRDLLLASKRSSSKTTKEIFAFSIDNPDEEPRSVMILDQSDLNEYHRSRKKTWSERLAYDLVRMDYSFNPSGVAVHPHTNEIYILSSPVPQLLILNKKWKIRSIHMLDHSVCRQPESIAFDEDANLFIANEGGKGKANLLKFEPK